MTDQQSLRSDAAGDASQPSGEIWRKEIHARIDRYRTRRGRRIEGAFTMRFPFPDEPADKAEETPEPEAMIAVAEMADVAEEVNPTLASDPVSGPELAPVPEEFSPIILEPIVPEAPEPVTAAVVVEAEPVSARREVEPEPEAPPRPRPRSKRKVIAFPKIATGSELMNRLADPVLPEQPRILDVPVELEAYPATPFLDGLQFGPDPQQQAAAQGDHIELPFAPATISRRVCAALVDCGLVAAATALFAGAGYKLVPKLLITKPLLLTAAVVPVLLWAVYQYLLTTYASSTVGMLATKTRLSTFKGKSLRIGDRRKRVLALYLSAASLMMGLLWALVDVDGLCWHDRISRTYLTGQE